MFLSVCLSLSPSLSLSRYIASYDIIYHIISYISPLRQARCPPIVRAARPALSSPRSTASRSPELASFPTTLSLRPNPGTKYGTHRNGGGQSGQNSERFTLQSAETGGYPDCQGKPLFVVMGDIEDNSAQEMFWGLGKILLVIPETPWRSEQLPCHSRRFLVARETS